MSCYYSPLLFLTQQSTSKELYQKVVEILDYTESRSESDETFESLNNWYNDIVYKYSNIRNITIDAVTRLIEEAGYSYILNILNLSNNQIYSIATYLPLIAALKGSRTGLELVLNVLNATFEITESWEDPQNIELYTYNILFNAQNSAINADFIQRYSIFSRKYVYPLLKTIILESTYTYRTIYSAGILKLKYSIKANVTNPVDPLT